MAELADEELRGVVPKIVEDETKSEWVDIGYYKTPDGKTHFGIKEQNDNKPPNFKWKYQENDLSRNRTSNPMLFYGSV